MKIALVIDAWSPIIGGGQKLFWKLAEGLVKTHHCQVTIVTRALKDDDGNIFTKNELLFKNNLKIIRLGLPLKWTNFLSRLWFPLQAAAFVLSNKFDLIHGSAFLPGITLQLVKIFRKTPVTFSAIGFNHFWQETNPGIGGLLLENLETFITQTLNYSYVITDDYQFYKNYQKKNIAFIPNGVEIKFLKKQKKWPCFTFLFVGRLDKRKGVNYLLAAFKTVIKKLKNVHLRIVGSGAEEKNYKNLAQILELNQNVKFIGRISDKQLDLEYQKAHCFVLPSLWEGHPLVLFEAWVAKLPVIATDVGSLSQFINQTSGYLVPPRDEKKLSQAILKVISNKDLSKLGENGYYLVKNKYSWEKTINLYYHCLEKLIA